MNLSERYSRPTPVFWRKVGDAINSLGGALQVACATFTAAGGMIDHYFYWILVFAGLQWAGPVITNFATDPMNINSSDPTSTSPL